MIAAKGVMFRQSGEYFINWHNAPRRQFVVNLTGTVEIVASDGEKRLLGPGSILLAEDLTGKGHTSRGLGGEERISLFIPLADSKPRRSRHRSSGTSMLADSYNWFDKGDCVPE